MAFLQLFSIYTGTSCIPTCFYPSLLSSSFNLNGYNILTFKFSVSAATFVLIPLRCITTMASKWPSHNIIIAALRANQITELDCNLIANAYSRCTPSIHASRGYSADLVYSADENGGKPSARAIGDRIDAWKKESGCSTLIVTNRRPEKKGLAAGKKRRLKQEPSHTEGCSTATDTEGKLLHAREHECKPDVETMGTSANFF